ncbi:hypothetical protein [Clostridium sp. UBA5119]|uniref:hypothetical protein n=1 Tax=Clostridium sp. UBA5119 TaxID=1946366 RepID=UPI003217A946
MQGLIIDYLQIIESIGVSSSKEQDAEMMLFPYRESYYDTEDKDKNNLVLRGINLIYGKILQ